MICFLNLQARCLDLEQMDDNATSQTQLRRINKEKDDLALPNYAIEKANRGAKAKVKASQKLQAEAGAELLKSKDANFDL